MGFAKVNTLLPVRTYEACDNRFKRTPKPRNWAENERPLGNNKQRHYRIVKPSEGVYEVWLYHQCMARYYAPAENGDYIVEYTYDDRTTSKQFMWYVLQNAQARKYPTTDGRIAVVPIHYKDGATVLTFDAHGLLVLGKSVHAPVYRQVMSEALKEWRKTVRQNLKTFTMLMETRVPELAEAGFSNGAYGRYGHPGKPFADRAVTWGQQQELWRMDLAAPEVFDARSVHILQEVYEACHTKLMAIKDWNADTTPVTAAAVSRSFLAQVLEHGAKHLHFRPKSVPLPMFPEHLPGSWTFNA